MYETVEKIVDEIQWTDPLADTLQDAVKSVTKATEPASIQARNFLGGTWLGHPVHPAVTDVAVGAWITASVLDVASGLSDESGLETASDIALGTGLGAAFSSAVTGWNDWSDSYGRSRKVGLIHGLLMTATTATYATSMALRLGGRRRLGALTALTGLGLLLAGTYLGGDEVFDLGYGVNHTAFENPPRDFTPTVAESELTEGKPKRVDAAGVPVMVVKSSGKIYALDDTCVHAGCSLSEGSVDGESVTCNCHGSRYRLEDGFLLQGPATRPEPAYDVRTNQGMVEVRARASR